MDHRELVFAVIKGEPALSVPYIPRLDIWYESNRKNGTLPQKYRNAGLRDITDDLGLGYHAVIPRFRDFEDQDDDSDIGLGIHRFRHCLYKVIFHNVKRTIRRKPGGLTIAEYETPYGTLSASSIYNEDMAKSGASLAHTVSHAIKNADDLKSGAYLFENAEIVPCYDNFIEFRDNFVAERGPAVGFASLFASPVHYLQKELMGTEDFFYTLYDYPDEVREFGKRIEGFCDRLFEAAANSPAEIIMSGANYDSAITTPPIFTEFITPYLKKQSDSLHKKGKFLLTHTDGENRGLLQEYLESGIDIADSVCPAPMTSQTLHEIRETFGENITIWGGIPSAAMLENTMTDYEFDAFLDMTLEHAGNCRHMIFGIADTTPPAASLRRILKIAERVSAIRL